MYDFPSGSYDAWKTRSDMDECPMNETRDEERFKDPKYKEILRNSRAQNLILSDSELVEYRESLWIAAAEYPECLDHILLIDAEIIRRKIAKMMIDHDYKEGMRIDFVKTSGKPGNVK